MSEGYQKPKLSKQLEPVPFAEHLSELRRRLFYVAAIISLGTAAAYAVERHLVAALLKPAAGQHFIYTSPGGGIDFLFRVCLYAGIALGIPVIVYNFLRYVEPAFPEHSVKYIYLGTFVSGLLALAGVCFGYFVGLPSAMNFLLHQTVTNQVQPLLTVQAYMSFVIRYLLGSALLLQAPLFIIFINRIKPLKPRRLLHYERWVILGAFVISGLMNPTPRIVAQLLVAGPLIITYQLSILIVAFVNRKPRARKQPKALYRPEQSVPAVDLLPQLEPTIFEQAPVATQTLTPQAYRRPGLQLAGNHMVISDFFIAPRPSA